METHLHLRQGTCYYAGAGSWKEGKNQAVNLESLASALGMFEHEPPGGVEVVIVSGQKETSMPLLSLRSLDLITAGTRNPRAEEHHPFHGGVTSVASEN